jgi:hypothetical protein
VQDLVTEKDGVTVVLGVDVGLHGSTETGKQRLFVNGGLLFRGCGGGLVLWCAFFGWVSIGC